MTKSSVRALVFQPEVYPAILRGVSQIVDAIRCTLGPIGGHVAIDQAFNEHKPPEVLDSGGIIARRIIELADRDEDMGAMLARAMIYRQHEQYGDGTATAAVLFQAIIQAGIRYIAGGGNAMRLRQHLQEALRVAHRALDERKFQVGGKKQLAQLAESLCHDPDLAARLGEIFETIGEFGQLDIRTGYERELKHEYVEGMYWPKGVLSRLMLADTARLRTDLENPVLFISDLEIHEARDLMPVLEATLQSGATTLGIVARTLSEQAIAFLMANSSPERLQIVAVKSPDENADERIAALEDLAILTGGTALIKAAGHTPRSFRPEMFGRARRLWATHQSFGLVGGKGDPRALRRHITELQGRFQRTHDAQGRKTLQERIGKLLGGSATLWIGGTTESEIGLRKALAERTAEALRAAVRGGVLPGGATALLGCQAALDRAAAACASADERAAYRILAEAVAAPARTLIANAGYDPGQALAQVDVDTAADGFDVIAGKPVNLIEAGLLDVAAVQKGALNNAVATAALVLSIDVLVHHQAAEIARTPG